MAAADPSPPLAAHHRVVGPGQGELLGDPSGTRDRFLVGGDETGGRVALVEHVLAPGSLAAPVHLHTREDEVSVVLAGRVGLLLGEEVLEVTAGHLVVKPRGEWHTFWNPGDEPARILEVITPAGLEELFRELDTADPEPTLEDLVAAAERYGARVDLERTGTLLERHGLH